MIDWLARIRKLCTGRNFNFGSWEIMSCSYRNNLMGRFNNLIIYIHGWMIDNNTVNSNNLNKMKMIINASKC